VPTDETPIDESSIGEIPTGDMPIYDMPLPTATAPAARRLERRRRPAVGAGGRVARRRRGFGSAGRHCALSLAAFTMLFPLLWAASSSFKPGTDVFSSSPLPIPASLSNYRDALGQFPIGRLLLNTAITAVGVTVLQLAVGVLAAWSFVRFAHRGQRLVLGLVSVAIVVPPQSLMIPQFLMISHLGLRDSYVGLIVPQLSACALAVLLLREHIRALPPTLVAAATLDGATTWETLRHIVLPLLRPAISAVGIVVFISVWNEFLWPELAAPSRDHTTIQIGLQMFATQEGPEYGPLLAAAMLATLPVAAAYLLASRRVTDAFLQSGLR
jgi:multiple sugar transport system permease protein